MKQTIISLLKFTFGKFGLQIEKTSNRVALWNDDKVFLSLLRQIEKHTLLDIKRCFMLYQFTKHACHIDGEVAEIGVYKGGTAKLISKTIGITSKTLYLFDTFSGMPGTDKNKDLHKKGDFSDTSLGFVKEFLNDCHNIQFYPGFFPSTSADVTNQQFCLVHIDVDIYKSVMDCCDFFYHRMAKGGMIIFDDYGFLTCPGAKIAVDEFFSDKSEFPCYLTTGQCFITKA